MAQAAGVNQMANKTGAIQGSNNQDSSTITTTTDSDNSNDTTIVTTAASSQSSSIQPLQSKCFFLFLHLY